jgi:hypothetical protein
MSSLYVKEALPGLLHSLSIAKKEAINLQQILPRLFPEPISVEKVAALPQLPDWSERVEAFASRYARFQDQLGEKLLPRYLAVLAHQAKSMIDVLNVAERLGIVSSAEDWLVYRNLRNRLVHEYVSDPAELADALNAAHSATLILLNVLKAVEESLNERSIPLHLP